MTPFSEYLSRIKSALARGDATEHTHRTALQLLVDSLAPGVTATNEPKRVDCGAPDYIISKGRVPIGYIEAKDVGKSLDDPAYKEQFTRYRESLGNLIVTDYLEFRWYVGGEHRLTARLADLGPNSKLRESRDGAQPVEELLRLFLETQTPIIGRPKELAERMARLARLIREAIPKALDSEDKGGTLHDQMEGFRRTLLRELSEAEFADMYAQTICYGLFAAWYNADKPLEFTREHAAFDLPKTNPFLRTTFQHIAGYDLEPRIAWVVDDVANLLARADREAILRDFGTRTGRQDPVVHFYETFLAAYDPKLREKRGVYYTPESVVSYIVRSVDSILKTDFGLADGLADSRKITRGDKEVHKVQILDPATGTGTFLHDVIDHIHESFSGNQGMWSGYVREHLLPRVFGFELLVAPYAIAHLKLAYLLRETGYDFGGDERVNVYLTNTLDDAEQEKQRDNFAQWLVDEANAAGRVKKDAPIMVVLGNPPYSGHSANKGKWISSLLHGLVDKSGGIPEADYFSVDGQPLGERNPKWLNDDYVKFIRFAQWRIEQTGYGILAFITNHGYLDNPTFRGMRQCLMNTFDDIYLLNLHGNSKKKEKCPDGSADENVFDIQQGVSIGIFVKRGVSAESRCVRYADLWGSRESKYKWLGENDHGSTRWADLAPSSPQYSLIPQDTDMRLEYECGWNVAQAFPINGVGMTTARDHLVIGFEKPTVLAHAQAFRDSTASDEDLCRQLQIPAKKGWDIRRSRQLIMRELDLEQFVKPIQYRPFDRRCIFYHDSLVWRTAKQVMLNMLAGGNLGLVTARSNKSQNPDHFFCSTCPTEAKCGESTTQSGLFPLYLYPSASSKKNLFDEGEPSSALGGRRPNLAPEFIADFSAKLGMEFMPDGKGDRQATFGPEDVFSYMYAVFHSPTYRARYAEFLKIDFPRLPLTSNPDLFRELCGLGDDLVALHLMNKQGSHLPSFPIEGSSVVEAVRYSEPNAAAPGRVWINATQYFEDVKPVVWDFHVGGYQVCQKWLKDRKGRTLTYDDQKHYQGIVAALEDTITLMAQIDAAIEQHGGFPIT